MLGRGSRCLFTSRQWYSGRNGQDALMHIHPHHALLTPTPLVSSVAALPGPHHSLSWVGSRWFSLGTRPLRSAGATDSKTIRNVAIIAHVDHGKTSLIDVMLQQTGLDGGEERAMDHNTLERERGITILAKTTSVQFEQWHVNIVDTPGHGDFGGEVERVLGMVDGVVLLVDATEGPMTQTKFVLSKALQQGIRPIVLLNKMDRDTARPDQVEGEIWDLFEELEASDEQMAYPTLYGSARQGWVSTTSEKSEDVSALFRAILEQVPPPQARPDEPFSMLVTTLDTDSHFGRVLQGRIWSGSVGVGETVKALSVDGSETEEGKVMKIIGQRGMERVSLERAYAGDIVGIAGFEKASVTHTICDPSVQTAIPAPPVDPPVLSMTFGVNDSPLAGREGSKVTSKQIKDRLYRELESNVGLKIEPTDAEGSLVVKGRGEMQLGVLIENMRREGFELAVSPPKVLLQEDEHGEVLEPFEQVVIDIDDTYTSALMEKMIPRKAEPISSAKAAGRARHIFEMPSRALIGLRNELNVLTRGTCTLNYSFLEFRPHIGEIDTQRKGVLVSMASGHTTAYALQPLEARGVMFLGGGHETYEGMIIGEHNKKNDIDVNPVKSKALTNFRTKGKDDNTRLKAPRKLTLEDCLSYMQDDELLEVTPKSLRLRKTVLSQAAREQLYRRNKRS